MGRYIGPVCRLCRREGVKLYLKGERCYSPKCAMERRPYPPGQHGQRRARRPSDYAVRLREKQKLRRIYGISETQFRNLFEEASRKKGVTGTVFLGLLESRLDNVVYRLGFAQSRRQARQMVRHGHVTVNGRRVDLPPTG
jgi:small subunit ribosomal protein S4